MCIGLMRANAGEIGEVIDRVKQTYIAKFEKNMKRW